MRRMESCIYLPRLYGVYLTYLHLAFRGGLCSLRALYYLFPCLDSSDGERINRTNSNLLKMMTTYVLPVILLECITSI